MKLILIDWLDAHSGRGWHPMEEIEDAAQPLRCRSVGWLVSEAGNCKVLVPHIYGEKNDGIVIHGCGDLTIPNEAILKMTVLRQR